VALIAELREASVEFGELWKQHEVRHRHGERRAFRHPRAGRFTLAAEILYLEGGQRMTVYQVQPGTRDHAAMLSLAADDGPSFEEGSPTRG
jgi:hypothetical protein